MTSLPSPRLEKRRAHDFEREILERARTWLPVWGVDEARDFGRALTEIAARFNSEVAERLDRAGDKMRRGLLDWLAIGGTAARPARMPVVIKMVARATESVLAEKGLQMQVEAAGSVVTFETETDVRVVPGRLEMLVAIDAGSDELFVQPPGLTTIEPAEPAPSAWRLKSFAAPESTTLQLDPDSGLVPGMFLEIAGAQYRIEKANKDLVTIDPPVPAGGFAENAVVEKVTTFTPFATARNRQEHALYLGHADLLNIEAAATIDVVGARALGDDVLWQYWGKVDPNDAVGWQPLTPGTSAPRLNAVVLTKPKGAITPLTIDGKEARWIRAWQPTVSGSKPLLQVEGLGLRINCKGQGKLPPCTANAGAPALPAEAMANTTPLVITKPFFPLGKEPRQFDAFYLASEEAFSKKDAQVQMCFELADPTFAALAVVREGKSPGNFLAGVANDRALHFLQIDPSTGGITRVSDRGPLPPPEPGYKGQVGASTTVLLDEPSLWRPPVWSIASAPDEFLVAVSAEDAIWIWHESTGLPSESGWESFGSIPAATSPSAPKMAGLVCLPYASAPTLVALRDGRLAVRLWPSGAQWDIKQTKDSVTNNPVVLETIVPVLVMSGTRLLPSPTRLVGVSRGNTLYEVSATGTCTDLGPADVATDVLPVACDDGTQLIVAYVRDQTGVLVTFKGTAPPFPLEAGERALGLDATLNPSDGALHFVAAVQDDASGSLVSWSATGTELFRNTMPAGIGVPGGVPTAMAQHVVVPGTRGDVLVAGIDLTAGLTFQADVAAGVVVPASLTALLPNDVLALDTGTSIETTTILEAGISKDGETFHPIAPPFAPGLTGTLYVFRRSIGPSLSGDFSMSSPLITLQGGDTTTVEGGLMFVDGEVRRVGAIAAGSLAPLDPASASTSAGVPYWNGSPISGRLAPFMRPTAANNAWNANLLDRATLTFRAAEIDPEDARRNARAFLASGDRPTLIVLDANWTATALSLPTALVVVVDAVVTGWARFLGDTTTNPELSWEYWNGSTWSALNVTVDETLRFKTNGAVEFAIPDDIAPTDWAGKTNHWIRARLIGGDYGREEVTVVTSPPDAKGFTRQTFERSLAGLRPPLVLRLTISYSLCTDAAPTYLISEDSLTTRDQSDANVTDGALVEAFVPLSVSLGRLLGERPPSAANTDDCDWDCGGDAESSGVAPSGASSTASAATTTGRSIFLGFAGNALAGDTIKVLLQTAEERDHDGLAPLVVEALVGDGFVPLVAKDDTRALGESGILTFSLPDAATPSTLFGQALRWIRLSPKAGTNADSWLPSLRGAYLNAVWASATETMTRELLGSSEGAPNLTLKVARPPLLHDSLELRVHEELGQEQLEELRAERSDRVRSDVAELQGDWVLWDRVVDPDDMEPTARVYALDETTGMVRFGDGRHGAIPPPGRDGIVAFRYQRTEPPAPNATDVPANAVHARTQLNLVSPVAGAEAAFAADDAAGGAPPEPDQRVLQFGTAKLRHRERAVTLRDLEDLTLASSPAFVQARALQRGHAIRLVVVRRGDDPALGAAQKRELKRYLLAVAPPSLRPDALIIAAPKARWLRIELEVRVATLDDAGAVADGVKKELRMLLDPAGDGMKYEGWRLGVSLRDEDVALAVLGVLRLVGIAHIALFEIGDTGPQPWPAELAPHEIVRLVSDGVRITFDVIEGVAA